MTGARVDLISVVLPYRDAADTLRESVTSILDQKSVRLELLAIDDGSSDEGPSIVKSFAHRDPRVRPLSSKGGLVAALELGRAEARGRWVARMDADDVSAPTRLSEQLEDIATRPRLGALGTRVEAFPTSAVGDGLRVYVDWQNSLVSPADHARDLFVEAPLCHPSVLLRRSALDAVGGWRDTAWAEDYDLWLRLDAAGWELAKLPRTLLRWRHSEGRATFASARYAPARFREARARFLAPKLRALGRPIAVWGAGQTGRRLARALEPFGLRADLFIDIDEKKIGRVARSVPIVGPDAIPTATHTVLVAVGARGARALVRTALLERGLVEGCDFLCAA